MANFDINEFTIAPSRKICRAPYGVRLISYNAVRCPAGHRPILSYKTRKFLKNRPVPGRLSNSPVMCNSVKSYDVSFICDHSIREDN